MDSRLKIPWSEWYLSVLVIMSCGLLNFRMPGGFSTTRKGPRRCVPQFRCGSEGELLYRLQNEQHKREICTVTCHTESDCRMVSTPASFSGSPSFQSRSRDQLSWLGFFAGFFQINAGIVPKLGHDHFLRHHSQFMFHYHPLIRWYTA